VPASLVPTLDRNDRAALNAAIDGIFPVSARHDGMVYDARSQSGEFGLFPIERVTVPTLWISAEDDLYGTLRVAKHAASLIPKAALLQYATGGHLLLGRGADLWPRVARFLGDSL
jgi:predicted alpha/beta hydrolase family esterase